MSLAPALCLVGLAACTASTDNTDEAVESGEDALSAGQYGCAHYGGYECPETWLNGRTGWTNVTSSWKVSGAKLSPADRRRHEGRSDRDDDRDER